MVGGGAGRPHEGWPWTGVRAPLLRVHELEEMVKDQETMAEQALEEEARRHREAYSRLEREKGTEIELLNTRWVPAGTGPPRARPSVPVAWIRNPSPKRSPCCNSSAHDA